MGIQGGSERAALCLLEGGRQEAYLPRVIQVGGDSVRLGSPLATPPSGRWLEGEWLGRAVSVRLVPRASHPDWPRLVRRMQSCSHFAVPRVYRLERYEEMWCALLEPMHGTSLSLRLATTRRAPSPRWLTRLVWQLAFALTQAHAHHLSAAPLSEDQLWITREHYLKISDWAIPTSPDRLDWADYHQLAARLGIALPALTSQPLLDWFERRARRRSVYESLR